MGEYKPKNTKSREIPDLTPEKYLDYKRCKVNDKEIARRFHISTATLSRWKQDNGLFAAKKNTEYVKLASKGYRDIQIAMQWGISPCSLYQWKKRRGLV